MLVALLHGVSFATAPMLSFGPFKIFVLSSSLRDGWRGTLRLALVPLVADIPVIGLLWFLIGSLSASMLNLLRIAGALFYIYLAYSLHRNAQRKVSQERLQQTGQRTFWQAVTAVWITPQVYINWATIGIPALILYSNQSTVQALSFLVGFYGLWIPGLAAQIILTSMAGRVNQAATRILVGGGALLLLVFAAYQIWLGFTGLL